MGWARDRPHRDSPAACISTVRPSPLHFTDAGAARPPIARAAGRALLVPDECQPAANRERRKQANGAAKAVTIVSAPCVGGLARPMLGSFVGA
jgi:hypothetical protein